MEVDQQKTLTESWGLAKIECDADLASDHIANVAASVQ